MSIRNIYNKSTNLVRSTKKYNRFQEQYSITKLYFNARFNAEKLSVDDLLAIKSRIQEIRTANARRWAENYFNKKVKVKLLQAAFKNKVYAHIKVCLKSERNLLFMEQLKQVCIEKGYGVLPYEEPHLYFLWDITYFHLMINLPNEDT